MSDELMRNIDNLYKKVQEILDNARKKVYYTANFEMVQAYWNIGREIVDEEQKGSKRADYGKSMIVRLSEKLITQYGKGFDTTNLWYMKQFYNTFKNLHAVSGE